MRAHEAGAADRSAAAEVQTRLLDAIIQIFELLDTANSDVEFGVSAFVLDFKEGFWQAPLHPSERKFFCPRLKIDGKDRFLIFLRMVQGSRSAPLCWATVAALLMRLTTRLLAADAAITLCYVDDPLFLFAGTPRQRKTYAATCILV